MRAICGRGKWLLRISGPAQQSPCHRGTARVVPEGATFTCAARARFLFLKHFLETSPLRSDRRFWQSITRLNQIRRHRGFVLHAVTRLHRPRLTHYYGIICHLTPRQRLLELPLEAAYRSHRRPAPIAG